jgi:hypothetical protein
MRFSHLHTGGFCGLCVLIVACSAGCESGSHGRDWTLVKDEGRVSITEGGRELICYRRKDVPYKPYVERFRTPAGVNILRDAPHDHLHHHGLMYAVNVNGVEFWTETEESGRQHTTQSSTKAPVRRNGWGCARIESTVEWRAPGAGAILLEEQRAIEV